MIKKIEEINKLGIFDSYRWKCSKEFNRYNVCFGFNGSGKSTLSNFFNLIATNGNFSTEQKEELFNDIKTTENGSEVKFKNNLTYPTKPKQENKKIYVFNSNFIANHVYDGTVGKMSKFNVKETVLEDPTIKTLNTDIETKTAEKTNKEAEKTKITEKFDEVKRTYNAVYREHFPNRQIRLGNVIPAITALPKKSKAEIEQTITQKIAEYKLSEKQAELEADIANISELSFEKISINLEKISGLLEQSAKENVTDNRTEKIEFYKKEVEEDKSGKVEPWFKLGKQLLTISKEKDNNHCPVCKTDLTTSIDSLIADFADYFDKSYLDFVEKLKNLKENIDSLIEYQKNNESNKNSLKSYGNKYNIINFENLPEKSIGSITKTTIKNKLSNLNKICDGHSHGNMQQLDECNFISDETLKEIANDTLDIIEFFDNMHKENIEELVNPVVAEATE